MSNHIKRAFAGLKSISTLVNAREEFSSNPNRSVYRLYPTVEDFAYYFFTNVCYDVDERGLGEFSHLARRPFKEVLDNGRNRDGYLRSEADSLLLVLERNGRFGIGTPATVVGHARGMGSAMSNDHSFVFAKTNRAVSTPPISDPFISLRSRSKSFRLEVHRTPRDKMTKA